MRFANYTPIKYAIITIWLGVLCAFIFGFNTSLANGLLLNVTLTINGNAEEVEIFEVNTTLNYRLTIKHVKQSVGKVDIYRNEFMLYEKNVPVPQISWTCNKYQLKYNETATCTGTWNDYMRPLGKYTHFVQFVYIAEDGEHKDKEANSNNVTVDVIPFPNIQPEIIEVYDTYVKIQIPLLENTGRVFKGFTVKSCKIKLDTISELLLEDNCVERGNEVHSVLWSGVLECGETYAHTIYGIYGEGDDYLTFFIQDPEKNQHCQPINIVAEHPTYADHPTAKDSVVDPDNIILSTEEIITWEWQEVIEPSWVDYYEVYVSYMGEGLDNPLATNLTDGNSFWHSAIPCDKEYTYRIRAVNISTEEFVDNEKYPKIASVKSNPVNKSCSGKSLQVIIPVNREYFRSPAKPSIEFTQVFNVTKYKLSWLNLKTNKSSRTKSFSRNKCKQDKGICVYPWPDKGWSDLVNGNWELEVSVSKVVNNTIQTEKQAIKVQSVNLETIHPKESSTSRTPEFEWRCPLSRIGGKLSTKYEYRLTIDSVDGWKGASDWMNTDVKPLKDVRIDQGRCKVNLGATKICRTPDLQQSLTWKVQARKRGEVKAKIITSESLTYEYTPSSSLDSGIRPQSIYEPHPDCVISAIGIYTGEEILRHIR